MDLLAQVKLTIEKFRMISPGDKVLAGVSGGADSVALAHLLHRLKEALNFSLCMAHLNHRFRGEEAEADARLVESLARQWEIPLVSENIDVPAYLAKHRLSPQQGAREVRYRFFRETADRLGASRVALGHHADDQAETVLLNLIRGAGLSGISGIPPAREGVYIRPLLRSRSPELELYCREFGLPFRVDSSNLKPVYLRNRVRLELIPLLEEKYNPAVVDCLNRLADIARDEDRYLEDTAREIFESAVESRGEGRVTISVLKIQCQPVAIGRRLIRMAYRELAGYGRSPTLDQVDRALELALSGPPRGEIDLPGGVTLVKRQRFMEIIKDRGTLQVPDYRYPLRIPGLTPVPEVGRTILAGTVEAGQAGDPALYAADRALLDLEKLKAPLCVRRRREGDLFHPLGAGGRTKLKKFFIELKVPREHRDAIPIVTCGNDIIWVAGFRPGDPFKVTARTRLCLQLELLEE